MLGGWRLAIATGQSDQAAAPGRSRRTGPPIAAELGDVHEQQVWRFLRAQHIDLDGRKSWCESQDPDFVVKAANVVRPYIAPPENAIVTFVWTKTEVHQRRVKGRRVSQL